VHRPIDNDEGPFGTGIPGDNRDPKWQDCFFDETPGGRRSLSLQHRRLGTLAADDPDCETSSCIDCAGSTRTAAFRLLHR
jgi:hypothetical protein